MRDAYDVAIIGGGPAGSTCASFLKKHRPSMSVAVFERETFPRDHVGESQLPLCSKILAELGIWDRVEESGFPVKIGATYRWGNSDELWDFNFLPNGDFKDEPRPARYAGQRLQTAFQVDRAIYDKILLDYSRELGAEVFEGLGVREVIHTGDRVTGLRFDDGRLVSANYFVDGSGHTGILRRAMGVHVEEPSTLKNIAVWDYWQNADWAVNLGIGGTRVQVMSLGYGWMWFIPLGPTRTSIGLVCPADYYKKSGLKPETLYLKAIGEEPRISALIKNAEREHKLATTKDWSFVSERLTGENWLLAGEAAGFADPVLAAGLSLTHASAKEAAFTILEMGQGRDEWLRSQYNDRNIRRVHQHIRFADYWYSANGHFSELKEFTREIAKDAGLELDAEAAFRWLGTGGFVEEDMAVGGLALFSLDSIHLIARKLSHEVTESTIDGCTGLVLDLEGAESYSEAIYENGRVHEIPAFRRDGKILPLAGYFGWLVGGLRTSPRLDVAFRAILQQMRANGIAYNAGVHSRLVQSLEALERDGWVRRKDVPGATPIRVVYEDSLGLIAKNRDLDLSADRVPETLKHSQN